MNLPKKLQIIPIVDATVEIRFTSEIFPNAVFGMIYSRMKKEFPRPEKLPILQLPEEIRVKDPGLRYKPHYRLVGEKYSIQIGSDVLSVSSPIPYIGWSSYSDVIFNVFNEVFNTGIIKAVTRLGVRYINFFDLDVFKKINLGISINKNPIIYKNTLLKTDLVEFGFNNLLQISNNSKRKLENRTVNGSIIDIDTSRDYGSGNVQYHKMFEDEINQAHIAEKNTFFKLLSDELLNELKPIY